MPIDRFSVKSQARGIIHTARPRVLVATAIMLLLTALFTLLQQRLTGLSSDDAMRYLQLMQEGQMDAVQRFLSSRMPSGIERLVNMLLDFADMIVSLGFLIFLLNTVRGTGAIYANLLDGFNYWWKIIILEVLMSLLVILWSLLLIVPGIVAAYRYSMARYLLITRPELGILDCLRESKRLTYGHKKELFMLDLSFLGWYLLSIIPIIGWFQLVWVTPYRGISALLYYEQISGAAR